MARPGSMHVVFVHGLFATSEAWEDFAGLLGDDPDLPWLVPYRFEYDTPLVRRKLTRRIPEINDIADRLRTWTSSTLPEGEPVVFVTHSMGGLVLQRFLARTVADGRADELRRIRRIVMFACPNAGSDFLLVMRRLLSSHAQEKDLRPLSRDVTEAQRKVMSNVVNAREQSTTECPIPIEAYGGQSDNVVPAMVAQGPFPFNGVVDGDHTTIIRPVDRDAESYRVLCRALLTVARESDVDVEAAPDVIAGPANRPERVSVVPPWERRDTRIQGRSELLGRIGQSGSRVHVLAGLGGCGKSRLALEIGHSVRTVRKAWWVTADRVDECMKEVAVDLGAEDSQLERAAGDAAKLRDLVWRWLDRSPDPWMLIVDDADDPSRLGVSQGNIADGTGWLRVPESDGKIVVTSRVADAATWGDAAEVHRVLPLDEGDGAALLLDLVHAGSVEDARALSRQLGGLPYALRKAAEYLRSVADDTVLSRYTDISNFIEYRDAVAEHFGAPPGAVTNELEELTGDLVRKVLGIALDLVERRTAHAATLLRLLACMNKSAIPYVGLLDAEELAGSALFPEASRADVEDALMTLEGFGLVEISTLDYIADPSLSRVVSLHPLVHGICRDDPEVARDLSGYYGLCVRLLLCATSDLDADYNPPDWVAWNLLEPHAGHICRTILLQGVDIGDQATVLRALELARRTTRYLIVTSLVDRASQLVEPIISAHESYRVGLADRELLSLRHEAGRIALERGLVREAEEELAKVIADREQALGRSHVDTLASRHKHAKAVLEQGRWAEAEKLLRAITEDERYVRGWEHADTLVVRHSLARAVLCLDRPDEAAEMVREILGVRMRESPSARETLYVRQTLAKCLIGLNQIDDARDEITDALALAGNRPRALEVMSLRYWLCVVLVAKEDRTRALEQLNGLLHHQSEVLGTEHPDTARTRDLLHRTETELPT